jgi:hypothetical protein
MPGRSITSIAHPRHGVNRDPDDNILEFYTELDQMKEEELGFRASPLAQQQPATTGGLEQAGFGAGVGIGSVPRLPPERQ